MVSIFLVMEGEVSWACFFVWIAWVFDGLDGLVARLTRRKNKIGSHLDATVDLLGCAIAPAVCAYGGYAPFIGPYWAGALACSPALFGIVRHARSYANPTDVLNQWVGLPRTYSGLGIAGLIGCHLFAYPVFQYIGIAYVALMPALGLTTLGFQGRHHAGLKLYQALCMSVTFVTFVFGLVMLFLGYGLAYFHDGLVFWMTAYTSIAWFAGIPKEERRQYRQYIQEWKKGFD